VAQNVALPLVLNKIGNKMTDKRVAVMLDAVKLGDRGESLPRELSGGEMQRVAIARALVHKPRLVFADEPTGNLDPESAGDVLALLRDCVKEEGAAGILVTHSSAAAKTADRIYVLTQKGLRPAK
jgi:putative ABC transport system ATP-binding protein